MTPSKLKSVIIRAFDAHARPAPIAFARSQSLESLQVASQFESYSWKKVPRKLLLDEYSAVHFLSDSAFAYFLPSMMLASLDEEGAEMLTDALLSSLAPSKDEFEAWTRRVGHLDGAERAAVRLFLEVIWASRGNDLLDHDWASLQAFWDGADYLGEITS